MDNYIHPGHLTFGRKPLRNVFSVVIKFWPYVFQLIHQTIIHRCLSTCGQMFFLSLSHICVYLGLLLLLLFFSFSFEIFKQHINTSVCMTSNKWWPHDVRPTFGSHSGVLDSDSDWDSDSVRFGYVRFGLGAQLDERMDGSAKSCEQRSNLDAPCRGPEVASLRIVACIICMSISAYCPRLYVCPYVRGVPPYVRIYMYLYIYIYIDWPGRQAGLIIMHMRVSSPLVSL